MFRVGYTNASGWVWTNLTSTYTTTPTVTWTPTTASTYTLVVWARLIGHTANYDQYATGSYQVTPPVPKAVGLTATPATAQVNTPVTLTAIPSPASLNGLVQYMFRVGYVDGAGWHWTNLTANTPRPRVVPGRRQQPGHTD